MAAVVKGIEIYLDGKIIPIKNFEEYVNLFFKGQKEDQPDDTGAGYTGPPIHCIYVCMKKVTKGMIFLTKMWIL